MKITSSGIMAGERFLREHCENYEDGTAIGTHSRFIQDLLMEVFRASGIALKMQCDMPNEPQSSSSVGNSDRPLLLVFATETDDVDFGSGVVVHRG